MYRSNYSNVVSFTNQKFILTRSTFTANIKFHTLRMKEVILLMSFAFGLQLPGVNIRIRRGRQKYASLNPKEPEAKQITGS